MNPSLLDYRQHRWKRLRLLICYFSVVCLSLCSNGRRYRHDFFAYDRRPCIFKIASKFGLYRSTHFSLDFKFCPKLTHPVLIWASETFDSKLRPNGYAMAMASRKPPSLCSTIVDPYDLPFPKCGPKCTQGPTSRREMPPGDYDTRYRQDFFCIRQPHQAMSPVSKLL